MIKESIETDRKKLRERTDKDLLVDIICELGGYGDRMTRLETLCSQNEMISNLEAISKEINDQIQKLSDTMDEQVQSAMEQTQEWISNLDEILNGSTNVNSIMEDIHDITIKVRSIESQLEDKYQYDSIAGKIESIRGDMEKITSEIENLKNTCEDMSWSIQQKI